MAARQPFVFANLQKNTHITKRISNMGNFPPLSQWFYELFVCWTGFISDVSVSISCVRILWHQMSNAH